MGVPPVALSVPLIVKGLLMVTVVGEAFAVRVVDAAEGTQYAYLRKADDEPNNIAT